jgi:hypothetical protein
MRSNCRHCAEESRNLLNPGLAACTVCGARRRGGNVSIPSLAFALLYLAMIAAIVYLGIQPPI